MIVDTAWTSLHFFSEMGHRSSRNYWCVVLLLLTFVSESINAEDPYRFFAWNVTYGDIYPLGVKQQVHLQLREVHLFSQQILCSVFFQCITYNSFCLSGNTDKRAIPRTNNRVCHQWQCDCQHYQQSGWTISHVMVISPLLSYFWFFVIICIRLTDAYIPMCFSLIIFRVNLRAGMEYNKEGTPGRMECMAQTAPSHQAKILLIFFSLKTKLVVSFTFLPLLSTRLLGALVESRSLAVQWFLFLSHHLPEISPYFLVIGSSKVTP